MAQCKCSLLKPVDSLTGTFFTFSQYAQDLTKQYANCDAYRCVPSKFIALNLDYSNITTDAKLGEIFENYYENACTFLRGNMTDENDKWKPDYALPLLFQTLEKYNLLSIDRNTISDAQGVVSGISNRVQYIGDINIYSYDDNQGGVGYNEIYCYIPNEAKCIDYQMVRAIQKNAYEYPFTNICGYEGKTSYNGLSWGVAGYIDTDDQSNNCYGIGKYGTQLSDFTYVPMCLNDTSNDQPRTGEEAEKFDINTIVVLYDIVCKTDEINSIVLHKNVPLGIYFTGKVEDGTMTNTITKYANSGQIYNQGTSYGLRVCTRFLTAPNSTEIIETEASGSSNVAEMAPVLEKIGELLISCESVLEKRDDIYNLVKDHLAQFKNNKVNVPYVRQLGNRKFWFVNGKNTGAVAEFETSDPQYIIETVINEILGQVYTKDQINQFLSTYVSQTELQQTLNNYATKQYVDDAITQLRNDLLVYLQGDTE